MNIKYLRIQTRYCGKTGKPVGIFGACWHLKRGGKLTPEEELLFASIESWFENHLPNPPYYKDGNPDKAVTWFKKETTVDMIERLRPLIDLLDKYQVQYDVVMTNYPGQVIYEDEYQVAVI